MNVPATGGWQTWVTAIATVTLPAGTQTLTVDQDSGGWNINFLAFGLNGSGGGTPPPPGEAPYGGTAAAVPGTVQAENYDTGGQGVAYNVTSTNGSANSYRSDGVDLEATTDTGGGYDLGWTAAGQWFKYTVNVATAGTYTVGLRLAAPTAVTDALHIANSAGTNLSGNVTAPATGGYQTWTTVTVTVTLPAGTQTLTVDQDNAGWNINYLAFATSGGGGTGGSYGGFPAGFWGNTSGIPSSSNAHRVRLHQRHQRRVPRQRGLLERQRRRPSRSPNRRTTRWPRVTPAGSTSTSDRPPASTTTSSS